MTLVCSIEELERERKTLTQLYCLHTASKRFLKMKKDPLISLSQAALPGAAGWRHAADGGHAHSRCPAQSAIGFQR